MLDSDSVLLLLLVTVVLIACWSLPDPVRPLRSPVQSR